MTKSISTSIPQVSATPQAYPLTEIFLSCSQAAKLIRSEKFIKPLLIDSQKILGAYTEVLMDPGKNYTPISAKIVIPEDSLRMIEGLRSLAFEIFNAQKTSFGIYQQADQGNVGMDSYARQKEETEHADTQAHFKLFKQCRTQWKLSHEQLKALLSLKTSSLEVHLFTQEYGCHTDSYRQRWIQLFQKIYCDKHPTDIRSCETKATDLCDYEWVKSMSGASRKEFEEGRICKLFPEAHVEVKNDPNIREVVQNKCSEALDKSSNQSIKEEL